MRETNLFCDQCSEPILGSDASARRKIPFKNQANEPYLVYLRFFPIVGTTVSALGLEKDFCDKCRILYLEDLVKTLKAEGGEAS